MGVMAEYIIQFVAYYKPLNVFRAEAENGSITPVMPTLAWKLCAKDSNYIPD